MPKACRLRWIRVFPSAEPDPSRHKHIAHVAMKADRKVQVWPRMTEPLVD